MERKMKKIVLAYLLVIYGLGTAIAASNYDKCYNTCKETSDKCYKVCKTDQLCKKKCNQNFNECTARCSTSK